MYIYLFYLNVFFYSCLQEQICLINIMLHSSLFLKSTIWGDIFICVQVAKFYANCIHKILYSWSNKTSTYRVSMSLKLEISLIFRCHVAEEWILFNIQAQAVASVSRRSLKCHCLQCWMSAIWLVPLQDHLLGHNSSAPLKVSASLDLVQSC